MIIRNAERRKNYCVLPNAVLNDQRLSWEARGLLGYLLSKPDHWEISTERLTEVGDAGRDKVLRMLNEFIKYGYLVRRRVNAGAGLFQWQHELTDQPQPGLPSMVEPSPVEPSPVNTVSLISTEEEVRTDQDKYCEEKSALAGDPPTDLEQKLTLSLTAVREQKQRASRLPVDWVLTPANRTYAVHQGVTPEAEHESFCDYWHSKAGKDSLKMDWDATWRMWCRRAAERAGPSLLAPRTPRMSPTNAYLMQEWLKEDELEKHGPQRNDSAFGTHSRPVVQTTGRRVDDTGVAEPVSGTQLRGLPSRLGPAH